MLTKFISMSETRFQNTETALKNQQASIQWLETKIDQLSKLISERSQGSLPSNTEPNPREQLNAINIQDDEGVVEPELEPRQETVVSKGKGEVDYNKNKSVTVEYKPRVPYPNAIRKDHSDEQFAHESFSSNGRRPTHEERRLQIEELDEWRTHKPRTYDKPKLRQNELDTFPNQLKVGDKVLLDAADAHIVTTTPNEEIPLTVLSIFPFDTIEVSHPKFGTFKRTKLDTIVRHGHVHPYAQGTMSSSRGKKIVVPASKKRKGASSSTGPTTKICHPVLQFPRGPQEEIFQILQARPLIAGCCIDWTTVEQVQLADAIRALLTTDPWELFFGIIEPTCLELTMELCSTMRMIKKHRGTYPPQYRLAQSTKEEAYEDIPDDFHPQYKDPPTQPPTPSRLVHAAASYADISECFTRFKQHYIEILSSPSHKNYKLHRKRFLMTVMSCSTTTIATTRYNILLAQDLWSNEPLPLPEYPPPLSHRLLSRTPV
ncbi:hypothetical protein GOBAR_AA26260 [Gossypium barbadense]|uniref:Uncharacterized protein n=1 Tax=Gossypium barbadense TaxID=3634 RepID=A0A2P5WTM3_GOSBA|nr:hypothetical protein GOBAR_AA26260 [Gossypium barbadense]